MFGSVWNFIKRHKRKFIFTGAVIGGVLVLGKYAKKKLEDYQDQEAAECLAHARRQHHFDSNQRTCNMTVLSMVPSLREAILQSLDSETLTDKLKNKPANRVEIWEELKIVSFGRTVVAVYSCCMLVVLLRVQLNIIGGYMYLDSCNSRNCVTAERAVANSTVQQRYLAAVQFLVSKGLAEMIVSVQRAVQSTVGSLPLQQQVSLDDFQGAINDIRRQLEFREHNGYHDGSASSLCRFMLPGEEEAEDMAGQLSEDEQTYHKLMKETKDMVESGDFYSVLTLCLDTTFSKVVDKLADYFKPQAPENGTLLSLNDVSMPLAKVIPIMNGLIHTILGDSPNPLIQELLLKEQVKDFAANVYEAFSQAKQSPA